LSVGVRMIYKIEYYELIKPFYILNEKPQYEHHRH